MVVNAQRRSAWAWLRANGRILFLTWDAGAGAGAAVAAALLVGLNDNVAGQGVTILLAVAAVAVALFAVVLAAMAIFATFFDDSYRQVLQGAGDGSIRPAMFPYEVVAVLAGATTLLALLVALAWPGLPGGGQIAGMGAVFALAGWSIAGSIRLVSQTAWHAEQRAILMKAVADARTTLERRKRKQQVEQRSARR
jgi:hypothetical protein